MALRLPRIVFRPAQTTQGAPASSQTVAGPATRLFPIDCVNAGLGVRLNYIILSVKVPENNHEIESVDISWKPHAVSLRSAFSTSVPLDLLVLRRAVA
jgi:hypothetical protein